MDLMTERTEHSRLRWSGHIMGMGNERVDGKANENILEKDHRNGGYDFFFFCF